MLTVVNHSPEIVEVYMCLQQPTDGVYKTVSSQVSAFGVLDPSSSCHGWGGRFEGWKRRGRVFGTVEIPPCRGRQTNINYISTTHKHGSWCYRFGFSFDFISDDCKNSLVCERGLVESGPVETGMCLNNHCAMYLKKDSFKRKKKKRLLRKLLPPT